MVIKIKENLRHYLNPMHVYCRLVQLGINKARALQVCGKYELIYRRVL